MIQKITKIGGVTSSVARVINTLIVLLGLGGFIITLIRNGGSTSIGATIGVLNINVNNRGEISFDIESTHDYKIPFFQGQFKVGLHTDPAQEFNFPNTLTVRYNGEDHIYNLWGQNFRVEFASGYYEKIRLEQYHNNIILELRMIGAPGSAPEQELTLAPTLPAIPTETNDPSRRIIPSIDCPGAYGPHFAIGDRFIVPPGGGASSVYNMPNEVPKLGDVEINEGGVIIGGPVCKIGTRGANNDGKGALIIWKVRTDTGLEGWMAEGYAEQIPWIAPHP